MMTQNKNLFNISKTRLQQRRILAMMGVDVWVQQRTPTVTVDFDWSDTALSSDVTTNNLAAHDSIPTKKIELTQAKDVTEELTSTPISDKNTSESNLNNTVSVASFKPSAPDKSLDRQVKGTNLNLDSTNKPAAVEPKNNHQVINREQIESFSLFGMHYRNWVLLVDEHYLKDAQIARLWQNITHTLAVTPERLQFPICEGIEDKESADASVAGFVFRLAKRDNVKVAALTPFPSNLDHDHFIRVPYLSDMLKNCQQKKELWQLISAP